MLNLQSASVLAKLSQYTVTHASDAHPHLFRLKKGDKKYFAKYTDKKLYEAEVRCLQKLNQLGCPSIIQLEDAIPVGEGGIIITPKYKRYEHEILRSHSKLVMRQVLKVNPL